MNKTEIWSNRMAETDGTVCGVSIMEALIHIITAQL